MTANDIHPINTYLPMNACTYDEVSQYYTVRCSEWYIIDSFELQLLDNGVYCASLFNAGRFNGISFYIPYQQRGKGKLEESINMFPTTKLVTMKDCHVMDVIKKYTLNVVMPPSLSDSFMYRDLRNSLCSVRGIRKDLLIYEINDYLNSFPYLTNFKNQRIYKMLTLSAKQQIDDIKELISE